MATEIKKYLDNVALGALVDQIKAEDAKVLDTAKKYADGLATNYDVAGSAATAEANAKAYTDALANGQVKTNKEAIETLNGTGEGSVAKKVADAKALIDADIDAVEAIANKNKEDIAAINNAETGLLKQAKDYVDAEDAKIEEAVANLSAYVGTIPSDATATNVVAYVQERTSGIATESAMTELTGRVTTVEGKVSTIEGDYLKSADKTELEGKITNVQTAVDTEKGRAEGIEAGLRTDVDAIKADYLKAADKTELVEAIASEKSRAEGEEGKLSTRIKTVEDDYLKAADKAELEGKITAEAERAAGVESGLDTRVKAIEDDYLKAADKEALQTQINTIMNNPDAEGAINSINEFAQYVKDHGSIADGMRVDIDKNKEDITANAKAVSDEVTRAKAAEEALGGRIDELSASYGEHTHSWNDLTDKPFYEDGETVKTIDDKFVSSNIARTSDVTALGERVTTAEGKITTLEGEMDAVEGAVATKAEQSYVDEKVEALNGADTELGNRITALEGKFTGEGSVEGLIADAKVEAIETAAGDATSKANAAEAAAKEYTDDEIEKVELTVAQLTETVGTKAAQSEVNTISGKVATLEGDMAQAKLDIDAVEEKAGANETAIGTINTELAKKAAQTDLDGAVARIAQNETDIAALEETVADKAETSALNDAIARIAKNEENIAKNATTIGSFVAITADEVNALFA